MKNKRILIGITGGIAAYKILELIRRLKDEQAQVKVVLTEAAKAFVTPLSVQALSGEKVFDTLLSADNEAAMSHIELARWAEVILIAPASANFIAKLANGMADDLLTTLCLATSAPVLVAPAMNQQMWLHPATQHNINILQQRAIALLGPASGSQACGEFGPGRMLEAAELLALLHTHFMPKLFANQHIVITAGPTQENIDPVRYISNHSSGKMGYALAAAALNLGAKVTLISGPTNIAMSSSKQLDFVSVISASEMHNAVMQTLQNSAQPKVDFFIGCAAVADYAPSVAQAQKIKKQSASLTLELFKTPDILANVASLPTGQRPFIIGFAAETQNLLEHANEKLHAKNLDLVIANSVANGQVFNQDYNEVYIMRKDSQPKLLPSARKSVLAYQIFAEIHAASTGVSC